MSINPDEDTEFNDALRAHGIIPPKPVAAPSPSPPPSPTLRSKLSTSSPTLDELELLADNANPNDPDEERLIESFRRQRLKEMQKESQSKRRFGEVYPIGRDDYTREVTEGSKVPEEDEAEKIDGEGWHGTGVICFLYQPGEPASVRLADQLSTLARRYPRTKIVSIVGSKCIENYPDRHCPTLFLYRNGQLRQQFIAFGKDRERRLDELEVLLIATNMIDPRKASKVEAESARSTTTASKDDGSDLDSEDDEPRKDRGTGTVNGGGRGYGASRNIRTGTVGRRKEDDDDDSDFDL